MVKTQIQLPDRLYGEAKRIAREREISFAEVVRRGVEYIAHAYPPLEGVNRQGWTPPAPKKMGQFRAPVDAWRILANE